MRLPRALNLDENPAQFGIFFSANRLMSNANRVWGWNSPKRCPLQSSEYVSIRMPGWPLIRKRNVALQIGSLTVFCTVRLKMIFGLWQSCICIENRVIGKTDREDNPMARSWSNRSIGIYGVVAFGTLALGPNHPATRGNSAANDACSPSVLRILLPMAKRSV